MTTYTVRDANSSDSGLTYDEAIDRIAEWYEDCDQWADGTRDDVLHAAIADAIAGVDCPAAGGGLAALEDYVGGIRQAVAEACGSEAWAGHGNYYVSAADQGGYDLSVEED